MDKGISVCQQYMYATRALKTIEVAVESLRIDNRNT